MCDYCADLHPTVCIKTPQKLSKILLRAADRLADGTLADITLAYAKSRLFYRRLPDVFLWQGWRIAVDSA